MKRLAAAITLAAYTPALAAPPQVAVYEGPMGVYTTVREPDPVYAILTYSSVGNAVRAITGSGALGGGVITASGLVFTASMLAGQGGSGGSGAMVATAAAFGSASPAISGQGGAGSMTAVAICSGTSASVALAGTGAVGGYAAVTSTGLAFATASLVGDGGVGGFGALAVSATGNATVALAGRGGAGSSGALTTIGQALAAVALTGQGGTGAQGAPTAKGGTAMAITGQGGAGYYTPFATVSSQVTILGQGGIGSVLTAEVVQTDEFSIDAIGAAGGVGTLTAAAGASGGVNSAIAGQGAAGGYGVVTSTGLVFATASVTGQGGAGGIGAVAVTGTGSAAVSLDGQGGAGGQGTIAAAIGAVSGSATLTGQGGAGSYSILSISAQHVAAAAITGMGGAGSFGGITAAALHPATVAFSVQGGAGSSGSVTATGVAGASRSLAGQGGSGAQGGLSVAGQSLASAIGMEGSADPLTVWMGSGTGVSFDATYKHSGTYSAKVDSYSALLATHTLPSTAFTITAWFLVPSGSVGNAAFPIWLANDDGYQYFNIQAPLTDGTHFKITSSVQETSQVDRKTGLNCLQWYKLQLKILNEYPQDIIGGDGESTVTVYSNDYQIILADSTDTVIYTSPTLTRTGVENYGGFFGASATVRLGFGAAGHIYTYIDDVVLPW